MSRLIPRIILFATRVIGGGSLLLFGWFLLFGSPFDVSIGGSSVERLGIDALLCGLFFAQHSGMIRRSVKAWAGRRLPAAWYPALYSIASGIALLLLVVFWQETSGTIVRVTGVARWISFAVALAAVGAFAWSVRSLGGFDPFGTLPLTAHVRGNALPSPVLVIRGAYRYVRHPLYLFMLVLIWCAPRLTADQLLFNVLWTAWIVAGATLEERDLVHEFGDAYRRYQLSVPMLIPALRLRPRGASSV